MKIRLQTDVLSFTSHLSFSSLRSCVDDIASIALILVSGTILPCIPITNLKVRTILPACTVIVHWSMQNPPQLAILSSSSFSFLCAFFKNDAVYCGSCVFFRSSMPGSLTEVCFIPCLSLTGQYCVRGTSEQHNNQPQLVHITKGLLWQQAPTEETLPWRPFLIV